MMQPKFDFETNKNDLNKITTRENEREKLGFKPQLMQLHENR